MLDGEFCCTVCVDSNVLRMYFHSFESIISYSRICNQIDCHIETSLCQMSKFNFVDPIRPDRTVCWLHTLFCVCYVLNFNWYLFIEIEFKGCFFGSVCGIVVNAAIFSWTFSVADDSFISIDTYFKYNVFSSYIIYRRLPEAAVDKYMLKFLEHLMHNYFFSPHLSILEVDFWNSEMPTAETTEKKKKNKKSSLSSKLHGCRTVCIIINECWENQFKNTDESNQAATESKINVAVFLAECRSQFEFISKNTPHSNHYVFAFVWSLDSCDTFYVHSSGVFFYIDWYSS